ncbi:MAG: cytochrome c class I [Cyclobacteriaceae bacterium]|jgi:cytochrome c|nr:cytochrome c class I [Cyclobacteriaceae bacterium]MDH4297541.1 cytochrome c class I [Cyclobacteriaceae bacterium]MDH5249104.1 cytochrome c class I [Cyclobacteriaceae bacterium]
MKKVLVFIALFGIACVSMTSCGSKKEAAEESADAYDDYETAEPKQESSADLIAQGQVLVDAGDCKTCHHPTNKIIGPSHTEVAQKYDFTKANVSLLAGKIMSGGSGVWGEIPMSPHPDISMADAEKMAMYVLSLDGEKPKD